MPRRLAFVLFVSVVMAPLSPAQRRGGGTHGFFPGVGAGVNANFGRAREPFAQRGYFLGDPFFYADYPFSPVAPEPASPQVIVVQQPRMADAPPEAKSEPLLIELEGDRYVRHGGVGGSSVPATAPIAAPAGQAHASTQELQPAVLIYRNGRREAVSDYAIVGGTIYARGDYWQNGSWSRTIQISALDLPATLKTNQENGVKFVLPSGPNEVVTRP